MSESVRNHLLTAKEMAEFVRDGYILFESIVPDELNKAVLADAQVYKTQEGQKQNEFWNRSQALREVFRLPKIRGIIESLVGPGWHYHHSFLHIVPGKHKQAQEYHVDMQEMFPDPTIFDMQPFYFMHDTPLEMGPTLVLPGSHMRRACSSSVGRYKNILGQRHLVAKAGSVAFLHSNIWHCAQPNATDRTRYVFKMRTSPQVKQTRLFQMEGYDSEDVLNMLRKGHPWMANESRKDMFQKLYFWRKLAGDDRIPIDVQREIPQIEGEYL